MTNGSKAAQRRLDGYASKWIQMKLSAAWLIPVGKSHGFAHRAVGADINGASRKGGMDVYFLPRASLMPCASSRPSANDA